jgi:hypothetical protein
MIPVKMLILSVVSLLCVGCSALDVKNNSAGGDRAGGHIRKKSAPEARYYEFKDVLIPGEFTLDKKHSSVVENGEMTSGYLSFYGRVDGKSVVSFFNIKMPENGWKPIAVIKSPKSSTMIFNKGKKWCTIKIAEGRHSTDIEIGMAREIEE